MKIRILLLVLASFFTATTLNAAPLLPLFDTLSTAPAPQPVTRIERTLAIVQRYYYDPKRINIDDVLESGMRALAQKLPSFLVVFSKEAKQFQIQLDAQTMTYSYQDMHSLMDVIPLFAEIFEWLSTKNILEREHLKPEDIEYAVCDGFLSTLDPHSNVLPPDTFREFQTQTEGSFGGVGIVIGMRDGYLTVIAPIAGTPAGRANVQSGDRIVRIDGEPSLNMPLNEAVEKLRGKVNTTVDIGIERETVGELNISLKREVIQIESVQSALLSEANKTIAYVRIKNFQGDTYEDLVHHLEQLKAKAPNHLFNGMILDMRNNPGGLLDQAVEISDLFLSQGPIVMTVGTGGVIEDIRMAKAPGTEPDYPIIVLVNGGSASASEIVAAALKDNGRALVVGDQSFGKGSVQSVFGLDSESAIKMTIAEYWTAARRSIQSIGIVPDIRLFPMKVSSKWMDLIPNVRLTESDLEKHLENNNHDKQEARFNLSYFDDAFFKDSLKKATVLADDEDPDFSKQAKEYDKEAHVEDDYWVNFSKGLLALYRSEPGFKADTVIAPWIATAQKQESQKLSTALKQLGIAWTSAPQAQKVTASSQDILLETTFKQDGKVVPALDAGKEGTIEVRATNRGNAPIYQLLALTESAKQHFIFDDKEFIFGKVAPGTSVVAQTSVKLPASLPTFTEPITYKIYSGLDHPIGESVARYDTTKMEKPRFSFAYTLVDRAGSTPSALAGNGAADPGELIELNFTVKNDGKRVAEDVQVNIKNTSGKMLILEKGRDELKTLNPQEEKKATLSFRLSPTGSEKTVSLELFISDTKTESFMTTRMNFPIAQVQGISPMPKTAHRPPSLSVSAVTPIKKAASKRDRDVFQVRGTLSDDQGVADLQGFAGDDKQCLQVAPKGAKDLAFTCTLSIDSKKKERFFYLEGRDSEGLLERAVYGIPLFQDTATAKGDSLP